MLVPKSGGAAAARILRMMAANSAKKNALVSILASRASSQSLLMTSSSSSSSSSTRSFVSATNMVLEKHITKVPTMGDSITEGTIVEWMAQIGQKVNEEDVIALIETDKVTVDIKATKAGVITQQFGAIDDEVEVGADLYEIDTEAEATVEAAEAAPTPAAVSTPESTPTESPAAVSSTSSADSTKATRTPSIKFLGKEGWERVLTVEPEFVIPASYGRLAFSEEEIEALLSGGANLAPELKEYSTGAMFSP